MNPQLPKVLTNSEMRDLQRDHGVGTLIRVVEDLVFLADHWWQYHDLHKEWIRIDDGETIALIESYQARLIGGLFTSQRSRWNPPSSTPDRSIRMPEVRCERHELIIGQCADCRPAPDGLIERVWITDGGSTFHRAPTCEALLDGQRKARRQGMNTHDPRQVSLHDAMAKGFGACMVCFPDYSGR